MDIQDVHVIPLLAFISNYMQGMRQRIARLRDVSITLCDILLELCKSSAKYYYLRMDKDLEEAAVQMLQSN